MYRLGRVNSCDFFKRRQQDSLKFVFETILIVFFSNWNAHKNVFNHLFVQGFLHKCITKRAITSQMGLTFALQN